MMSMWEYEQAKRTAHEQALLASFNFPYNPERLAKVEAELLLDAELKAAKNAAKHRHYADAENTALRQHLNDLAF